MEIARSVVQPQPEPRGKLLHILGVTFGIAVTVGGMIGLGILRTPGSVTAQLGNVWFILIIWVLGGVYAVLGTLSVAELSTSLPQAGGWYVYARRAFGDYGGLVVGWSDWLANCSTIAFVAITFGEYLTVLAPALSGRVKAIALTAILLVALLNWVGLRSGSRFQEVTSFLKALAFMILVVACFTRGARHPLPETEPAALLPPDGMVALFVAVMLALQSVIFTYDGWYSAIYFAEEDRDPSRNLPRAMITGVVYVMALYLLINLAFFYVLPLQQIATSTLPAGSAAQAVFGERGNQIITLLALITLPSTINICLLITPRQLFAMSRDGLFSSQMTKVNRGGTPSMALLFTVIVAIFLIATGTFEILLSITAFLLVMIYGSGFLAIFILRKREPELPRPFKVWGYPWTTLIVLFGSIIFLIGQLISDTRNSIYALVLIAISYPIFLLMKKTNIKKEIPIVQPIE
jgi:APA family basic amino acid/polyamine antiporter